MHGTAMIFTQVLHYASTDTVHHPIPYNDSITISISPKESREFSRIVVVAPTEQGNIWHRMLPCLAPYAPLLDTEWGEENYS